MPRGPSGLTCAPGSSAEAPGCSDLPGAFPKLPHFILTTDPGTSLFPISQTKKLRLRQVEGRPNATQVQSQELNPSPPDSMPPSATWLMA